MADLIGVTPVHLHAMLGELKAAGFVSLDHRELIILDHGGLLAAAGVAPWRISAPEWLPGR